MNQQKLLREIFSGNAVIPIFAVLASFLFGGILIAFANEEVQEASGYFFARPMDTIAAVLNSVFGAYDALFRGSIFNYQAATPQAMIKPITETLAYATPITLAGLGLAVSFRSGLFNIGAQGQIIFGAMFAAYVGLSFEAPFLIHMPMAVIAGLIGGALWGGLVGLLKATTGANEVVVTIMFNYIALLLLTYLLKTPVLFGQEKHYYQTDFSTDEFENRRAQIYDEIGTNGIALIQSAPTVAGFKVFRQTNSFY